MTEEMRLECLRLAVEIVKGNLGDPTPLPKIVEGVEYMATRFETYVAAGNATGSVAQVPEENMVGGFSGGGRG